MVPTCLYGCLCTCFVDTDSFVVVHLNNIFGFWVGGERKRKTLKTHYVLFLLLLKKCLFVGPVYVVFKNKRQHEGETLEKLFTVINSIFRFICFLERDTDVLMLTQSQNTRGTKNSSVTVKIRPGTQALKFLVEFWSL